MLLPTPSGLRPIVSFLVVAVVYWLSLWRIFKGNRGNRVIECGSIALMLFFLMMLLIKLKNLPDWVLPSLGLLLFLLCLLTMFFLVLQGVQAIRHRKSKTAASSSSAANFAMYGLDYSPRNSKEKWLMRIVYWGTILLVAFIWWEYVKAR
jgi:thiol:disulfide interchange protein